MGAYSGAERWPSLEHSTITYVYTGGSHAHTANLVAELKSKNQFGAGEDDMDVGLTQIKSHFGCLALEGDGSYRFDRVAGVYGFLN